MDMHPPPAYVQLYVQKAQAVPGQPLQLGPPEDQPPAPVEPVPVKIDVSKYVPQGAAWVTILMTLTPPSGQAVVYTEGAESSGTLFNRSGTIADIPLDGPYIYVKLYGATSFAIKYIDYRIP
jgi:hypothetical protein